MPKVSAVPGSPQSSTSTVMGSLVVPVGRMTEAVPVNLAVLLPGVSGQEVPGLLMNSVLYESTLMRTSEGWSLYSRFPVGGEPSLIMKPNVACAFGSARLGTRAGNDTRLPTGEKTGSPWI